MDGTISIAQAVRDVLESNWLYFQMLHPGIANFTALAIKIEPDVEKRSGTSVSTKYCGCRT